MKKYEKLYECRLFPGLFLILFLSVPLSYAQDNSTKRELLDSLVAEIDMELYDSSVADIRAWLDAQIESTGKYGIYDFGFQMGSESYRDTLVVCDSFDLDPYDLMWQPSFSGLSKC